MSGNPVGGIQRISGNNPLEQVFGYKRAVRAGDWVMVSGTTATDESGRVIGVGQAYAQTTQTIRNIAVALGKLGLGLEHVVRTRLFVTDISRIQEIARAHREAFGATPPASTGVEVSRLVHPDMIVEIEAVAYAGPGKAGGPQRSGARGGPKRRQTIPPKSRPSRLAPRRKSR